MSYDKNIASIINKNAKKLRQWICSKYDLNFVLLGVRSTPTGMILPSVFSCCRIMCIFFVLFTLVFVGNGAQSKPSELPSVGFDEQLLRQFQNVSTTEDLFNLLDNIPLNSFLSDDLVLETLKNNNFTLTGKPHEATGSLAEVKIFMRK